MIAHQDFEKIVAQEVESLYQQMEEQFVIRIQPRPKWLPEFIWKKLLRRLLIMEHFHV